MKRRWWKIALLLLVPLTLYEILAERASWELVTIDVAQFAGMAPELVDPGGIYFTRDGRYFVVELNGDLLIGSTWSKRIITTIKWARFKFMLEENRIAIDHGGLQIVSLPDCTVIAQRAKPAERFVSPWAENKVLLDDPLGKPKVWKYLTKAEPVPPENLPPPLPEAQSRSYYPLNDTNVLLVSDYFPGERLGLNLPPPLHPAPEPLVQLWDVSAHKQIMRLPDFTGLVADSGNGVVILRQSQHLEAYNYKAGKKLTTVPELPLTTNGESGYTPFYAISRDGQTLALAQEATTETQIWDLHTAKLVRRIINSPKRVSGMDLSRDGRTLGICYEDGTVNLWRIK